MNNELGRALNLKNIIRYFALITTFFALAACGNTGGTSATLSDIGSVEGVVSDATTGNVVVGVTVQIGNQTATTGNNGVYSLSNLTVGSRTITATMTGYQNHTGDVTVQKGTTVKHDIQMSSTGTKTTATLKINLSTTLPASTAISGAGFTLTLPANVTPALTNGVVATGAVLLSGTFANSLLSPQAVYTAATASLPGLLKVTLASSTPAGVTQVGEVATITLQLANGAVPTASSFVVSAASVIDAALYAPITGMNVVVASVVLQ